MKLIYTGGSDFTVKYNQDDAAKFSDQWPGSLVDGSGWFTFQKKNGDLVDMGGGASNKDGSDWLAFSQDCQKWGEKTIAAYLELTKHDHLVPETLPTVLDKHGGFTAETVPVFPISGHKMPVVSRIGNTLWRPGAVLKKGVGGKLIPGTVNPKTFYQTNDNVRSAKYKVPGYQYPVICWWDNVTNERIA